jgi:hypothetical protein
MREKDVNNLKINIRNNISHYKDSKPWLDKYFGEASYSLLSNIQCKDIQLKNSEGSTNFDLENTKILYSALKNLRIPQATDERLWSYLAHTIFWEYMVSRWKVKSGGDEQKTVNFIKNRYFFDAPARGPVRNGLARLWWYGYITYDESLDDPFELTEVLYRSQQISLHIGDRSFTRNPAIRKSILQGLKSCKYKREPFDMLMIEINRIGGVTVLDSVDKNFYKDLTIKRMSS